MDYDKMYRVFANVMIYSGVATTRESDLTTDEKKQFLEAFATQFARRNIEKNFTVLIENNLYNEDLSVEENQKNIELWFLEQLQEKHAISYDTVAGSVIGNIVNSWFIPEVLWNLLKPTISAWVNGEFSVTITRTESVDVTKAKESLLLDFDTYQKFSRLAGKNFIISNNNDFTTVQNAINTFLEKIADIDVAAKLSVVWRCYPHDDDAGYFNNDEVYIICACDENNNPLPNVDLEFTTVSYMLQCTNSRTICLWAGVSGTNRYNGLIKAGVTYKDANANITSYARKAIYNVVADNVYYKSSFNLNYNLIYNFLNSVDATWTRNDVKNAQEGIQESMTTTASYMCNKKSGMLIYNTTDKKLKYGDVVYVVYGYENSTYAGKLDYALSDDKKTITITGPETNLRFWSFQFHGDSEDNFGQTFGRDVSTFERTSESGWTVVAQNSVLNREVGDKILDNVVSDDIKDAIKNGEYDIITDGKGNEGGIAGKFADDVDNLIDEIKGGSKTTGDYLAENNTWQTNTKTDEILNKTDKVTNKEEAIDDAVYPSERPGVVPLPAGTVSTGFYSAYNPTKAELSALADQMWSDPDELLTNLKKMFTNPIDSIISLSQIPAKPATSGRQNVKLGAYNTNVSMPKISSQYCQVDCGRLDFSNLWTGYENGVKSRMVIYLPFIGVRELSNPVLYIGGGMHLVYNFDILSGACCAYLFTNAGNEERIVETFSGMASQQIPVSATSWGDVLRSIANISSSVAGSASTAGIPGAVASGIAGVTNFEIPGPKTAGSISGNIGFAGSLVPQLMWTWQDVSGDRATNAQVVGYPCNEAAKISTCKNYVEATNLNFADTGDMTYEEQKEIEALLEKGVFL